MKILIFLVTLYFGGSYLASINDTITINGISHNITDSLNEVPIQPSSKVDTTTSPTNNNVTTSSSKPTTVSSTTVSSTSSSTSTSTTVSSTSSSTPVPTSIPLPSSSVTPIPSKSTTSVPSPTSRRAFDGASFVGGIVLASGLMAIGFIVFKFYHSLTGRNYHTL